MSPNSRFRILRIRHSSNHDRINLPIVLGSYLVVEKVTYCLTDMKTPLFVIFSVFKIFEGILGYPPGERGHVGVALGIVSGVGALKVKARRCLFFCKVIKQFQSFGCRTGGTADSQIEAGHISCTTTTRLFYSTLQGFRVKEGLSCVLFHAIALLKTRKLALQ